MYSRIVILFVLFFSISANLSAKTNYCIRDISSKIDKFRVVDTCDSIFLINGQIIEAKILEVNDIEIKYKKCSFTDGPVFIIKKEIIEKITYKNGDVETIQQKVDNQKSYNEEYENFQKNKTFALAEFSLVQAVISTLIFLVMLFIEIPFLIFLMGIVASILAFINGIISLSKQIKHKITKRIAHSVIAIVLGLLMFLLFALILISI